MKELREYQKQIVNKVIESEKDLLICLPTGSGKTLIALAVIQALNVKNLTVVFVVPRLELIEQAKNEFGDVDVIWSDKTKLTGKKCIVASKDSLRSQCKKVPENVVLIFDEAHVSLEQTFNLVKLIKPLRVLGLTATPERMDGKALLKGYDSLHKFGVFDELLQEETVSSLIKKGYLCPLKYYTKPIDGIVDIKPDEATGQELSDEQMSDIFDNNQIWGDLVKSYETYGIENGIKRPALGFTSTVSMGKKVCQIFNDAGYNFKIITGQMGIKERKSLINQLKNREVDGLINAALLTYGFDCPAVSYAFSCRHIKSRPLWFQIVGRILRNCEGKSDAIFIDHGDSISEFEEPACSLPILDPYIVWKVNGETKEEKQRRKKTQKKERDSIKILQDLDPLPCQMVEVKPEDTWERMIKVLQRLKTLNDNLFEQNKKMRSNIENINNEKEKLQKELKATETKRFIDSEKTFEFIRKNYCFIRNTIHSRMYNCESWHAYTKEKKAIEEHQMTIDKLLKMEKNLPFLFDTIQFNKSMEYWFKNWSYRPAKW
ncbi:DEAD/DEAH box helicase [Treponema pectinovorum]|uniref:DEAD/DEAH box helicase n=1 Tax=Treponema pectinovorum TaxID=164 RepID=UPI0011F198B3|nr:DEAD/DEAH box helicase [Treponema pectinovorum]